LASPFARAIGAQRYDSVAARQVRAMSARIASFKQHQRDMQAEASMARDIALNRTSTDLIRVWRATAERASLPLL
jgi:hypothetical protein